MSVILPEKYIKELNFDSINKNIELNLNLISKYPRNSFLNSYIELTSEENLPANSKKAIIDLMKIEQLIDIPNEHMLNVTKLGYEVVRKGGWIKYLEIEKIKSDRLLRKDIIDFSLSKFKYYTFWPIFIFAFVGFGFSVCNFITSQKNQENAKLQEQRIENMESELTKLRISISVQKNLDSLSKTKVLTTKTAKEE